MPINKLSLSALMVAYSYNGMKHYIDIVVTTCGDYYIIIISSLNNSFTKCVFVVENLIKNHRNY